MVYEWIDEIHQSFGLGITCHLLTGDNSKAANAVAYKLNIKPGNTYA
jgi:cation transport ATPase